MDKVTILINGEERTNQIRKYYCYKNKLHVEFKSGKVFHNYRNNIKIKPTKHIKLLKEDRLFVFGEFLENIDEFYSVGTKLYLIKHNGREEYYNLNDVEVKKYSKSGKGVDIKPNSSNVKSGRFLRLNNSHKTMLSYFEEIAKHKDFDMKKNDDENSSSNNFLQKQFSDLKVDKESVFASYLERKTIPVKPKKEQVVYPFGINLSQREAVLESLSNQVTVVQGPPGTGKTQSILNIIANCIIRDETIAIVSSNNVAVRNVLEKLDSYGLSFIACFLGNEKQKNRFFESQKSFPSELEQWGRTDAERDTLYNLISSNETKLTNLLIMNNRLAEVKRLIEEYSHEYEYFKKYSKGKNKSTLRRFKIQKLNARKSLLLINDLYNEGEISLSIWSKFKYFFNYGIYNFEQFAAINDIVLGLEDDYYVGKIKKLEKECKSLEFELENKNFEQINSELQEQSMEYFKSMLARKYLNEDWLEFNKDTYRRKFSEFIRQYPVMLSSLHSISNSKNREYLFDYVVVDEASMAELVPGILGLNSAKNAVIVGDLYQLPHIPSSSLFGDKHDQLFNQYNIQPELDYLTHSLLKSVIELFGESIPIITLKEHYRCDPRIIGFCNEKYYKGELICHSKNANKRPMVALNTVKGNHMRFGTNAMNKITNVRELESLMDSKFLAEIGLNLNDESTFGFMSPFRGQVNTSIKYLPDQFESDTVHKYQGRECDVMMFSSVLDSKASKKMRNFVDDPNLIHVAVSRAKECFIIVANTELFKKDDNDIADLIKYIEYYDETCLVQSEVRSIFDLLYKDYAAECAIMRSHKFWGKSRFDSENLAEVEIRQIISSSSKQNLSIATGVHLKKIVMDYSNLTDEESKYVSNNAHYDFVVYNKFDRQPVLAIEIDGYASHENNPNQWQKDSMKDSISQKMNLKLLRLKTNASGEREKILHALENNS